MDKIFFSLGNTIQPIVKVVKGEVDGKIACITDQKVTSDMAMLEDKPVQLNSIPIAVSRESQRLEEQYVEIERYTLNAGLI